LNLTFPKDVRHTSFQGLRIFYASFSLILGFVITPTTPENQERSEWFF
jgi:hypothetical protein